MRNSPGPSGRTFSQRKIGSPHSVILVDGLFLMVKAGVRMWRNMKLWLVFCSSLKWDLSSRLTSPWKVKAPFKPRRRPRTVPWQIPLYVVWFVLCHTLCWGHRQCLGFLKARHRNVTGGRHTKLRDFGDGLTVSSRALITTELLVFIFSALILSCIHHSCWAVMAGASVNPEDLCLYAKVITFHSIWLVFL